MFPLLNCLFLVTVIQQARFRVYGLVSPVFPKNIFEPLDLAHVFAGGRVVKISDQHFGKGSNLLLPGRGVLLSEKFPSS